VIVVDIAAPVHGKDLIDPASKDIGGDGHIASIPFLDDPCPIEEVSRYGSGDIFLKPAAERVIFEGYAPGRYTHEPVLIVIGNMGSVPMIYPVLINGCYYSYLITLLMKSHFEVFLYHSPLMVADGGVKDVFSHVGLLEVYDGDQIVSCVVGGDGNVECAFYSSFNKILNPICSKWWSFVKATVIA